MYYRCNTKLTIAKVIYLYKLLNGRERVSNVKVLLCIKCISIMGFTRKYQEYFIEV